MIKREFGLTEGFEEGVYDYSGILTSKVAIWERDLYQLSSEELKELSIFTKIERTTN